MNTNLIIAPISFSKGMAGTMLLQYLVNELRKQDDLVITNLIMHKIENQIDNEYYFDNVYFKLFKYNKYFANLFNLREIFKILKIRKIVGKNVLFYYDVNYNPFDFLIYIVALFLDYKIVFYETELYRSILFSKKEKGFLKILIISINQLLIKTVANHIFCISNSIKSYYKVKSSILPIVYNSIKFAPKSIKSNDIVQILYSGSFGEKDNLEMLLHVAKNIKIKGHSFILNLTGRCTDDQYSKLLEMIANYDIEDLVFYKGFLSNDDYYNIISESDICVVPRTSSSFANIGFPFKLGEYLAMGKAIIVSDTGDISVYLSNDDVLFVKPDCAHELENGIIRLITDELYRTKLAINGQQKAYSHFSPIVHVKNMIQIFNSL